MADAADGEILKLLRDIQAGQTGMTAEMAVMKDSIAELKGGVAELKGGMAVMTADIAELKGGMTVMTADIAGLKAGQEVLASRVELNGKLIEFSTAVINRVSSDMHRMHGETKSAVNNLARRIGVLEDN